jgi:amino acid adenylation domain-containing protein
MITSLPYALDQATVRSPEQEAVRYRGQSLTYAELHQHATRLACVLQDQGVQRGDRVGVYLRKSLEAIVALYGIMKAGAAYVPLDPFAPVTRLGHILADCGIRCLISEEQQQPQLQQLQTSMPLECVIGVSPTATGSMRHIPWHDVLSTVASRESVMDVGAHDLAYILYTSGSTGTPKGIVHTHSSALGFAQWAAHEYGLSVADRVSNHAPLHFDLSTFDLFAAVLGGATTVIIPEYLTKFPSGLAQLMAEERLSVWYSVPYALIQLLEHGNLQTWDIRALRWVLFAGEPFPTKHLRRLMAVIPQARFSNLYGPTETNVCTYYHVEPALEDNDTPIPIGRPCAGTETLVIDEQTQPVPQGDIGELLVRGPTLMRGYWGRPELDARSFVRHAGLQYGGPFYRTGDLVQCRPDGNYFYLGRKDRQMKIRGYRVELDEIEATLLAHEDVQEAAVYTVPDSAGSQSLTGAVIPRQGAVLTVRGLIQHVARRLPPYAVPADLMIMDDFPRTSTGKIDRRALQQRLPARTTPVPTTETRVNHKGTQDFIGVVESS